jgi:plastocyanin
MRSPLTLALLLALAAPAGAVVLRGRVTVPPAPPAEARFKPYAGRASSLPSPERAPRGLVTDTVIYVDSSAAEPASPPPAEHPQLAQKGQAFDPRVVVVSVGGTVDFPNLDPIYHNVFSVSPPRRFDLGKYPRGQSRSITFPKPGQVNVFCDIHSDMAGFILVVPNPHWARPAADGRYELPDLPAGRCRLRAWHPDFPARVFEVDVPASGDVTLDVSL